MKSREPRSIAELSHAVAEVLRSPHKGDVTRFRVMDLSQEIMERCDLVSARDDLMRDTLRSWIGRIQAHAGLQGPA